ARPSSTARPRSGGHCSRAAAPPSSSSWVGYGCSNASKQESRTLLKGTIHAADVWKRFRTDQRPTYLQDHLGRVRDRLTYRASMRWRWALRDVEVLAEPGDSLALVGANGAGKSTL